MDSKYIQIKKDILYEAYNYMLTRKGDSIDWQSGIEYIARKLHVKETQVIAFIVSEFLVKGYQRVDKLVSNDKELQDIEKAIAKRTKK